ncbi:MAG: PEP/pyruvate-binding domain-containing protein [Candidatus Promineifilaceae bacterium]|jgi:pyruvate,water dikinase
MNTSHYTCWMSEARASNPDLVGEKGVELNQLAASGTPIPPGFCITVDAYNYLLKVTGLNMPIDRMLAETNFEDQQAVETQALAIRELIKDQPIPREIASEVLESYNILGRLMGLQHLESMLVSVSPSFPNIETARLLSLDWVKTYPNVQGGCSILKHTRCCWASLWSARFLKELQHPEIDHSDVKIAVVVQALEIPTAGPEFITAEMAA